MNDEDWAGLVSDGRVMGASSANGSAKESEPNQTAQSIHEQQN